MKKVGETRAREDGERACASPQRASALGRQTELLPRFYSPGEVGIVGQPRGLRHQRRGDRPVARAAGEHDPATLGIGNRGPLELRHRKIESLRIALDFGLIWLADIYPQNP